ALCPFRSSRSAAVCVSQTFAVLSSLPVTIWEPSGLNAASCIQLVCPTSSFSLLQARRVDGAMVSIRQAGTEVQRLVTINGEGGGGCKDALTPGIGTGGGSPTRQ